MFKEGDKLCIRYWEDMEREFKKYGTNALNVDGILFLSEMKHLCGQEFTVKRTELHDCVTKEQLRYYSEEEVEVDGTLQKCWIITEGMLEPLKELPDVDIADFELILSEVN